MAKTQTAKRFEPQTVNVEHDHRVVLSLPTGENLMVTYAKVGQEHYLTVHPNMIKTQVEIYGKVPNLRTSLGQKIDNYQMIPLTEEDFD